MAVTPLQAAIDVLDRAEALLTLDPGTAGASSIELDVRRQAVAMSVAALDTWMHWAIRRVDLDKIAKKLADTPVPFGALIESGRQTIAARKAGKADRPQVRARNILNEKILTMTFQSGDQWNTGLAMLGIVQGLTNAGKVMNPPETSASIRDRLGALSHRRNMIVHEGDLVRLLRPQTIRREALLRADVDTDIAWIRAFLTAVDTLR